MTNWSILGIEPTTDKSTIKKAYRARLAETNPEDKPEEFMALREAYEQALDYVHSAQDAAGDQEHSADGSQVQQVSPMDMELLPADHPAYGWTRRMQALYCDFGRRIDENNWTELLQDPVCTRLDTAADAEDALLRFLMEWWFVPDAAVRAIDEVYDFRAHQENLLSRYPKDFVDAILLTPLNRQGGGLNYALFQGEPDADYDGFINMYYSLTGMVNRREQEDAWQCLQEMDATGISHPYSTIEKAKLYLNDEKPELAAAEMASLWPTFENDATVCCMSGEVFLVQEDFQSALERFQQGLRLLEDSRWAKIGLAEANLGLKDYREAENWVNQVLAEDRYSPRGQALEEEIQKGLKEDLTTRLADGEASAKERLDLAVIYIDSGECQAACDILTAFTAREKKEEAERLHYLATAQLNLDEPEASLGNFRRAGEILRELREVTADEEEKAKLCANLARTSVMESVALENLGQTEEALTVVINTTIDFPDLNVPFCRRAELHYELKQYQEAIDNATRSIELDSSFHLPYRIRGNAYYELGYYNDAYEDCNDCISRYAGDIEAYFCKINILIEVSEFQMALEELDNLEEQVQGTQITFLRGKALEASGDCEKARSIYRQVLDMAADKEREVYPPAEVKSLAGTYYRLYQVCQTLYDKTLRDDFWKESMQILRQGCREYPSDISLISELAGELYRQSRHGDAQPLYEHMAELEPTGRHYAQLAGNELQMDRFPQAKAHLNRAKELDPDLTYTEILFCSLYLASDDCSTALIHIEEAQKLADKREEVWYRILRDKAMVCARMKEYDRAIECYQENYRLYQQQEDVSTMMEVMRLAGRFRQAVDTGEAWLAEHSPEESYMVLDELKLTAAALDDWELISRYCDQDSRGYHKNFYAGRFLMYSSVLGKDTPQQALHHFEEAEKSSPSSISNLIEMAKLYLKLQDRKKAYQYAGKVLEVIPDDFMDCGYQRSFYLARSAEALAILGKYNEAIARANQAIEGRKCDFCKYSGCIDAYCALVYICCIRGDAEGAAKYRDAGLAICAYDSDLLHCPDYFMMKKRGFFR